MCLRGYASKRIFEKNILVLCIGELLHSWFPVFACCVCFIVCCYTCLLCCCSCLILVYVCDLSYHYCFCLWENVVLCVWPVLWWRVVCSLRKSFYQYFLLSLCASPADLFSHLLPVLLYGEFLYASVCLLVWFLSDVSCVAVYLSACRLIWYSGIFAWF